MTKAPFKSGDVVQIGYEQANGSMALLQIRVESMTWESDEYTDMMVWYINGTVLRSHGYPSFTDGQTVKVQHSGFKLA